VHSALRLICDSIDLLTVVIKLADHGFKILPKYMYSELAKSTKPLKNLSSMVSVKTESEVTELVTDHCNRVHICNFK